MAITRKSKLKQVMKNEEACEIFKKYMPNFDPKSPYMKMAMGMSVQSIVAAPQAGVPIEDRDKLFEELEAGNFE